MANESIFKQGLGILFNGITSVLITVATVARTWTLPDKSGTIALLSDITPSITITTAVSITSATTDGSGLTQDGRNVIIDNGANAINYTINGPLTASFTKYGTGAITFVAGAGRTLTQVDGTNILNGAKGSTATIVSVGTEDLLRVSNA